jgi:hypothetical protein
MHANEALKELVEELVLLELQNKKLVKVLTGKAANKVGTFVKQDKNGNVSVFVQGLGVVTLPYTDIDFDYSPTKSSSYAKSVKIK